MDNLQDIVKFVSALVFVIALMGGLSLVLRRFASGHAITPTSKRRLKIVESLTLDARHRAVILRRDECEHLVILGPNGETVVETGVEVAQDKQA